MTIKKLSIIIPAYNEGKTIHRILDKVSAVQLINNISKEIIIINDFSNDDTESAIQKYISETGHTIVRGRRRLRAEDAASRTCANSG